MAKQPTTITYVDTHTGRTHRFDAQVADGATSSGIRDTLARLTGMPTDRIRITRVTR